MGMNDLVIISVDDHISEPADVFTSQLAKEFHDKAPRLVTGADGAANWVWGHEGVRYPNVGLNAVAGRPKDEFGMLFGPLRVSAETRCG